jgi:hypothetical protein
VSERPETDAATRRGPRWDRHFWGTEILFPGGAKLVIDNVGVGVFTDPSGEMGIWDDTLAAWVDPSTGDLLHPQFGPPGFELSAPELEEAALALDDRVAAMEAEMAGVSDPDERAHISGVIQNFAQRAIDLHEHAAALGGGNQ